MKEESTKPTTPAIWKQHGIEGTAQFVARWNGGTAKSSDFAALQKKVGDACRRKGLCYFLVLALKGVPTGVIALTDCGKPRAVQPCDAFHCDQILRELPA